MTFEEYKEKRSAIDDLILKYLKDDLQPGVAYELYLHDRLSKKEKLSFKIFRQFQSLEKIIMDNFNEIILNHAIWVERPNNKSYSEMKKRNEHQWWEVRKYLLVGGEYEEVIGCNLTLEGKMIDFRCRRREFFDELFQNQELMDVLSCKNVPALYENGDIIKVNSIPNAENFYAIYGYDNRFDGYNHRYMMYDEDIEDTAFYTLIDLRDAEKVTTCPDERINKISRMIKENPEKIYELFDKYNISSF